MKLSKITLIILGIIVALMGVAGLVPSWGLGTEPMWHAIAKIIVGGVGVVIAIMDKK